MQQNNKARRKQYRQRNRDVLKASNKHQSYNNEMIVLNNFISYSSHLLKKQQNEMKVLQKIDYNYSQMPMKKNDNDMFLFLKQKGRQQTQSRKVLQKAILCKGGRMMLQNNNNNNRNKGINNEIVNNCELLKNKCCEQQQYQQIDTSAVVIKGRLIYLKQQTGNIQSNDELLYLLRQNNICNKQYLTGDQKKILQKISTNESMKQNQIIKDYILRNMSQQSNGQVIVMERFHQIKNKLFD